jgi:hypothetical protein
MAREVATNLFVGGYDDYLDWSGEFVVSATKTAHVAALGYAPDADDPNYLSWACQSRLTINWVDGPARLYAYGGVALFKQALDFIGANLDRGQILIHCDEGMSRSPTLALVYLAKRARSISGSSFAAANTEFFRTIYPDYFPGGIADYVEENWDAIR